MKGIIIVDISVEAGARVHVHRMWVREGVQVIQVTLDGSIQAQVRERCIFSLLLFIIIHFMLVLLYVDMRVMISPLRHCLVYS